MTPKETVARLQSVLKRVMKDRGLVYADAAAQLEVSLPTVKRLLNRDDISVAQLTAVADWLQLSLRELVNLAFTEKLGTGVVTPEQEEFLALNPHFTAFLGALMEGHSLKTIAKKYRLSDASVERYLLGLDKAKLIEYAGKGRVRLLVDRFLSMRDLPKLRRVFYEHFLDVTHAHFKRKLDELADAYLKMVMVRLTRPTYLAMKAELDALYEKYLVATKYETRAERADNLEDVTLVLMADTWKHRSFDDVIKNLA